MAETETVGLAPRQYAVAQLAASGLRNKEIAAALGVSLHTVRNTMSVVFARLGVENRVGLANAFVLGRVALLPARRRPAQDGA